MDKFSFAPYNFIPFSDVKVPKPYASREELPRHNEHVKESFSGRISFNVKALGEIAVGAARKEKEDPYRFCQDVSGRYVIQGSTMRGFIRSHAEILGFAYPEYITDETFLYRKLAGNCKTVRDQYSSELKADMEGGLRLPNGVKAGWIFKKGTSYYIQPVREFGNTGTTFFQIHERDLRSSNILTADQYMYEGLIPKFYPKDPSNLEYELKSYNRSLKDRKNYRYKPYRGSTVSFDYEDGRIRNIGGKDAKFKGTVLNSAWMNGKTHHYLVSAEDVGSPFEVPKDQIAEYNSDYDRNCIQNKKLDKLFYELPGRDREKKRDKEEKKLFFYKMGSGGRMIGFGPTPYFRIFYKRAAIDGIPMDNHENGYDYVRGMFGYVNGSDAYKSRISFSDAVYTGSATKITDRAVLLMGPRGTAIQMYLEQQGKNAKTLNTYNMGGFRLKGYKIYWKRKSVMTSDNENTKIVTHLKTLPAGSVFRGEIRFENLSKGELGLLLLSIRYADTADQHESFMIGGGKPYGFGHIEIQDISLSLIKPENRYTSLNVEWDDDATGRIAQFKTAYKDELSKKFGINLEEQESVKIYKAYAGIKDVDNYLESSDTIYMPVSRAAGASVVFPVYADFHPLKEARDILTEAGSKIPATRSTVSKVVEDKGKVEAANTVNRQQGAVWIAKYPLSEAQRHRIEEMGLNVLECVNEWVSSSLLEKYAQNYDTVLLPAKYPPEIEKQAKAKFSRVYCAKKSGKLDDGWKAIKI